MGSLGIGVRWSGGFGAATPAGAVSVDCDFSSIGGPAITVATSVSMLGCPVACAATAATFSVAAVGNSCITNATATVTGGVVSSTATFTADGKVSRPATWYILRPLPPRVKEVFKDCNQSEPLPRAVDTRLKSLLRYRH